MVEDTRGRGASARGHCLSLSWGRDVLRGTQIDVTVQCAPSAKTSVHHKSAHSGTTAHNTHRHSHSDTHKRRVAQRVMCHGECLSVVRSRVSKQRGGSSNVRQVLSPASSASVTSSFFSQEADAIEGEFFTEGTNIPEFHP